MVATSDMTKPETAPRIDVKRGALFALALGTFAVGTEGFMIAAILSDVAKSLAVSIQAAGQLVTIFAIVYAISSPMLTAATAGVARRPLLLSALAVFAIANLAAAFAPGYWSLAAARVLLALSAGLFVPNANAFAGVLVPPSHRGRALAVVNGGITVAVAIGVPLGAVVGGYFGWRFTFVGVTILSLLALLVLAIWLPRSIATPAPASLGARLAIIRGPGVLTTLGTTTAWSIAAYAVYTYIGPYLVTTAGLNATGIAIALSLLGFSAIIGVALGGVANDQFGSRRAQAISLPAMAAGFAGLTVVSLLFAPTALAGVIPLLIVWGVSAWAFHPPQQDRLIAIVGTANAPIALSLNSSSMYLGFSLGAALGSTVIAFLSVQWIGAVAAGTLVVAMALSHIAWGQTSRAK